MISILVATDDRHRRDTARHQLMLRGYKILLAACADEAEAVLQRHGKRISGLLVDIDLSGKTTGWDVSRAARALNSNVAVAYLSAAGPRDWAVHGVPDSIIMSSVADGEIADAFLRHFEQRGRRLSDRYKAAVPAVDRALRGDREAGDDSNWPIALIRHEHDILSAHIRQSPSFIAVLTGPEHRFTFANGAYARLVERDVVGLPVTEALPEAAAQGFIEILDRVYTSGTAFRGQGVDFAVELRDGVIKRTLLNVVYRPIIGPDGPEGIFVEGEDLTERHSLLDRVSALQSALLHRTRVNAMGLFASTLAHELSQPLTTINNYMAAAILLANRDPLAPGLGRALEGAEASAVRAGEIIKRLRAMTTYRTTKLEPVELTPALREIVALAAASRRDATVQCELGSSSCVHADVVQLQQVLLNLLQNSFDAAGSVEPRVTITTFDAGPWAHIQVRDFGPGIDDAFLPMLFNAFATTKAEGMGIGLSLCKTIVEGHGGTISAGNAEGGGAAITIALPRIG